MTVMNVENDIVVTVSAEFLFDSGCFLLREVDQFVRLLFILRFYQHLAGAGHAVELAVPEVLASRYLHDLQPRKMTVAVATIRLLPLPGWLLKFEAIVYLSNHDVYIRKKVLIHQLSNGFTG